MGLFTNILDNIRQKKYNSVTGKRSKFIFYKIVDFDSSGNVYKLQCINSRPTFDAKLSDIVFDPDILFALHPIQACFIGIEYGKSLRQLNHRNHHLNEKAITTKFTEYSTSRYGHYRLDYQTRKGHLGFEHQTSLEKFLMDPCEIASSEDLIREFDASQAFFIGLLAGRKIDTSCDKHQSFATQTKRAHLRVVK